MQTAQAQKRTGKHDKAKQDRAALVETGQEPKALAMYENQLIDDYNLPFDLYAKDDLCTFDDQVQLGASYDFIQLGIDNGQIEMCHTLLLASAVILTSIAMAVWMLACCAGVILTVYVGAKRWISSESKRQLEPLAPTLTRSL